MADRETAMAAAERLRVFAQAQRLLILSQLLGRELSVAEIDAATGIGQPTLSQQLAELRRNGVVEQRRSARRVMYRLAEEKTAETVRFILSVFGRGEDPQAALTDVAVESRRSPPRAARSAAMFAILGG